MLRQSQHCIASPPTTQSIGAQPSMPVPTKLQDFMQEMLVNASPPNGSLKLNGPPSESLKLNGPPIGSLESNGLTAEPWGAEPGGNEWQEAVRQLLGHYEAGTIPKKDEFLEVLSVRDSQNQGLLHVAIAFQHLPSVVHLLKVSRRDVKQSFLSSLATAKDRYEASCIH